ncbi:DUF1156 domain-containing protein [Pseudoflavonifractor sp. 524-17]|uniref:DUF1156 domain-containing protein n=1 Tax=Pseudoflavonifractor sp. 524-17 TaxID=2304577 RepID=UPI00137A6EFC|nr:DUF1156 domain-containing protein [Pseudoflavonifractor sp. 524-17]NCE63386.1 DUF1156 domain-containing protein [Pseudoflavonifractor sp. 524-17]
MGYKTTLIEGSFPCQQVGAETKRERGASSALPPLYFLHVWWARRPLTPSRAAVLGSILPGDTDPELFLQDLGLVKKQAVLGGVRWTLTGKNLALIQREGGTEALPPSPALQKALQNEAARREKVRVCLRRLADGDPELEQDPVLRRWYEENSPLPAAALEPQAPIPVVSVAADPAHINERIAFAQSGKVTQLLGRAIQIDPEDLYAYGRAYESPVPAAFPHITVLDPTAGGGSIPFEAARLGCKVISNDLNPVASVIEMATIQYPARYGRDLYPLLERYGTLLADAVAEIMAPYYHFEPPSGPDRDRLLVQCGGSQTLFDQFDRPEYDQRGLLYCRTVTCPSCGERAPLLNSFALQKRADGWMVQPEITGLPGRRQVRFVPVRLRGGKGPQGEDPERGTVKGGVGTCLHCGQAISGDEIKRQACGQSQYGAWSDLLYCVAAVREQPKRDKNGAVMTYTSGPRKGEVRTEKVTFFRAPTAADYEAVNRAQAALDANWDRWLDMDLIPTETIPAGHKTAEPLHAGARRWHDFFTPRQLLGHLTAMETLRRMTPAILEAHGQEKGAAILTYLQYMVDKCIDYNSRQTRWHYSRGAMVGSFGRHDFSLKWTFGELIYTGPNSALAWGRDQVLDAYEGICRLLGPNASKAVTVLNGSAANLSLPDQSVDVICMDPPYYNNVQYAELSDYFYVWQKRTFRALYPQLFGRRLTNKADEAVANPARDGGAQEASQAYEQRMSEIFAECRRVLRDDGILTVMFTHKTQAAWETLTQALIENGWVISSSFPVDSESGGSLHQKDMAAAASSIFLACRKREPRDGAPALWNGFGGAGVLPQLRQAVRRSLHDFEPLRLNPVDEMVASYGSALKVLSEHWPVLDGDTPVSPTRAMLEASTVVYQHQITRLTQGRLTVNDLAPEAGAALTLLGIYGTRWFPYDDALSLSKSLNIRLEHKPGGYRDEGRIIGINDERTGRRRLDDDVEGYYAPLIKRGSRLRLALPEERNPRRLEHPQSGWDIMQGVIMAFRDGDMPVARAYLQRHAGGQEETLSDLLTVWEKCCGNKELSAEAQQICFGLRERKRGQDGG